jgi:cell division protein FtsN
LPSATGFGTLAVARKSQARDGEFAKTRWQNCQDKDWKVFMCMRLGLRQRIVLPVVTLLSSAIILAACSDDPHRHAAAAAGANAPPTYHIGDSLTFEENGDEQPSFVTAIQNDQVYWIDNSGTRWITFTDPTIPPLTEIPRPGRPSLLRFFSPEKPTVFPLEVGKKIDYTVTVSRSDLATPYNEQHSCEVHAPRQMTVEAGTFDAWEIVCERNGMIDTYYYAPKIGAVVLKRREAPGATRRLTLVDYHKAQPGPDWDSTTQPAQSAGGSQAPAAAPENAASAKPTNPISPAQTASAWNPVTPNAWPPTVNVKPATTEAQPVPAKPSAAPEKPNAGANAPPVAPPAAQTPAAPSLEAPAAAPAEQVATNPPPLAPAAAIPVNASALSSTTQAQAARPTEVASSGGAGNFVVQLGAYPTYNEANQSWQAMRARIPQALGEYSPQVEAITTVDGKQLIRLMVGPFGGAGDARKLCNQLQSAKQDCWVRQAS